MNKVPMTQEDKRVALETLSAELSALKSMVNVSLEKMKKQRGVGEKSHSYAKVIRASKDVRNLIVKITARKFYASEAIEKKEVFEDPSQISFKELL